MLLNCHTYYSYRYGTLSPKRLVEEVKIKGHACFALTDINSTSACLDFIRHAPEQGIRPVVGIDFRNGSQPQYVGIARNKEGFRELNEYLNKYVHAGEPFPDIASEFQNAYVIYPFSSRCRNLLDNEFIGIRPNQIRNLPLSLWKNHLPKLVILHPVTFSNKRDFNAHRLLRAIDKNTLLSKLSKTEEAQPDEIVLSETELSILFSEYPMIHANTKRLLDDCGISFEFGTNKNKRHFTGSAAEDIDLVRRECQKGLEYRYGTAPLNITERMEKELKLILELGFCSYFLINWDMVNYARNRDFYYVGRGSGANSMVAYLLRITNVDPVELDLYFERFINPYRINPPDFDIDFSSLERDDVTRYLFDRHGWDHTALVGAYSTFSGRSVIRELGKVFGMPTNEIDKLQRTENYRDMDEMGKLILNYYKYIQGFPNHLSVHSSGILISQEPISHYSATIIPPKGYPTVHFSMLEAEDIGLHKFDILGQRGLGKIKDALRIIKTNTGTEADIHDLNRFKKDKRIREQLKVGKTIGCFYVESPAMRMLLTKLRADDYLRLVAASSIIRPGVSQSGMMNEYIKRFHDVERREKARRELPDMYAILEETYGVMVYQEDVIKVAHYFGGLSLSEADILRRGMSWKFRERNQFDLVKDKFFSNCFGKGHSESIVQDIWKQIESFASYAFAKGHSASYAVESYQALFLKAYWPIEYMAATVNNGGGFYRTEVYIHEARMHGAIIELPCVNSSEGLCSVVGSVLYIGLGFLSGLENQTVNDLILERTRNGLFSGLRDFIKRVPVSLEQLRILIRIGAFRFTGKGKKELLWDAHFLLGNAKKTKPGKTLFVTEEKEFSMPLLWSHELEDAFDERELLGFTVNASPFSLLQEKPDLPLRATDLRIHVNKDVRILGYLVHIKHTHTHKGQGMNFGTWLDYDGQWIDTVHFPGSASLQPFRGPGCYIISGKVMDEFGFISIDVQQLERLPMRNMDEPSVRLRSTATFYNQPQSVKTGK
jgi:DNA polymerase III subunit alpha